MNRTREVNNVEIISTSQKSNNVSNKVLWTPMKIVQIYLSCIFILFVFGPWPWPIKDKIVVYFYLFMAQILLIFGYFLSVRRKKITILVSKIGVLREYSYNNQKIIKYLLILSFVMFIPNYIVRMGLNSFSVKEFINAFIGGLVNPGAQYYYKLSIEYQVSNSISFLILNAITSPFRWLFIPLCIINWNKLKKRYKIGLVIFIVLDTISWISIGTNKGVFDNVFILAFSLLVKINFDNTNLKEMVNRNKSKIHIIFFSLIILSLAIIYMINAIKSRLGTLSYYHSAANIYVDFDSPIISFLPDFLKDTIVIMASYATQGYYGLSLAMKEPFTTTYGFGNSWVLLNIFEKITGNDSLFLNTYPFKIIGYGWDPYINWHSIYTWLASDFSFLGTLILMILIGYFFGEVWKSVVFQKNIFAVGLFILFMIMFMYFPANNQIFAYINTFAAFWGLFILWLFSAKVKISLRK